MSEKQSQIKDLQTEKELKEGGEIKQLQKEADQLNMKWVWGGGTWA